MSLIEEHPESVESLIIAIGATCAEVGLDCVLIVTDGTANKMGATVPQEAVAGLLKQTLEYLEEGGEPKMRVPLNQPTKGEVN